MQLLRAADWPALWALLEPVFRAGETFPHNPGDHGSGSSAGLGGAEPGGDGGRGCGWLAGGGAHVANAGYVDALVMVQSLVEGPDP